MLSEHAQSIITRLEVEDRERRSANRERQRQIHAIKMERVAIARERAAYTDTRLFVGSNRKNAHSPERNAAAENNARIAALDARDATLAKQLLLLESKAPIPSLTAERIHNELDAVTAPIIEVARPDVPLIDGERNATDALPRLREATILAKAARREASKMPLPTSAVKEAARREIKRLAGQGVPYVRSLFNGGGIDWPKLQSTATNGPYIRREINAAGLVAFLFHDLLVEKLDQLIDVQADIGGDGPPLTERKAMLAKLDAEIDHCERIEAAAVEAIIADGGKAFHRPDASVFAVLGLKTA